MLKPGYIQENVSLKSYNTWKTGGEARFFVLPENIEQYKECIAWALVEGLEICYLGQGSNALISDQGFKGLVICSKKFQDVEVLQEDKDLVLRCDAGALKYKVMRLFLKYNLSPALFLSGIPGDVGGGVVMNAGVGEAIVPREFCEIVKSIKVLKWEESSDLKSSVEQESIKKVNGSLSRFKFEIKEYQNKDIDWSYRSSKNWQPGFIFEVVLSAPMDPISDMAEKVKVAINNRKLKQPWDKPSCGSVFVNPPNHRSGQLIESCDLKGFQIGGAQVSYKHANFIVNTGSATSQDIHRVIESVKTKVFEKFQVSLHTEVVYIGPWDHLEK
jgi:UDP-N-acetylmuramate dehydrogenase